MSPLVCAECAMGAHSRCEGDMAPRLYCRCSYCKRWVDAHGPFSVPEDEERRA